MEEKVVLPQAEVILHYSQEVKWQHQRQNLLNSSKDRSGVMMEPILRERFRKSISQFGVLNVNIVERDNA